MRPGLLALLVTQGVTVSHWETVGGYQASGEAAPQSAKKWQEQIARAIEEMEKAPTAGDVRPMKSSSFKGALRKRVGRYRIVFSVDPSATTGEISAILARTGDTCR